MFFHAKLLAITNSSKTLAKSVHEAIVFYLFPHIRKVNQICKKNIYDACHYLHSFLSYCQLWITNLHIKERIYLSISKFSDTTFHWQIENTFKLRCCYNVVRSNYNQSNYNDNNDNISRSYLFAFAHYMQVQETFNFKVYFRFSRIKSHI